jgi:hypothetical protein
VFLNIVNLHFLFANHTWQDGDTLICNAIQQGVREPPLRRMVLSSHAKRELETTNSEKAEAAVDPS